MKGILWPRPALCRLAVVLSLETEGGGINLWGAFVGVTGTDRWKGKPSGGTKGVSTGSLDGKVEAGVSIVDERGVSTGRLRGIGGGGMTLRWLCA